MWFDLALIYDKFHAVRRETTEEASRVEGRVSDPDNHELTSSYLRQIEIALHDMASRTYGGLAFEQTTRDIIVYFIKNRTLSQKFLEDYEKLRAHLLHGTPLTPGQKSPEILLGAGFSSALDNARDLLMHLHSISYANEKMIYELLSNFEWMILQDLEILKQAEVSAEVIGKLIANMELALRQIQQNSHNEVQKLLSERQKTP